MIKITFRTLLFCLVALCVGNAHAATLEFSGSPTSITAGGETTLTWKYTGPASTTYCSASGAWSGKKNLSGQQTFFNITTTSKYNLSCTDARSSVTITVVPAPTVSLSANPTSISSGASSTLTWSSTNATSCAASGAWSGDKTASVSEVLSNILATSSYTLTCTGTGGSASQTATVTVTPPPDHVYFPFNETTDSSFYSQGIPYPFPTITLRGDTTNLWGPSGKLTIHAKGNPSNRIYGDSVIDSMMRLDDLNGEYKAKFFATRIKRNFTTTSMTSNERIFQY